jgi:stage V sporulation protein G
MKKGGRRDPWISPKLRSINEDKLKAYITVVLDNCFVVRDLKVIQGNTGLFVAMPSKKRKDGSYRDVAHPLNKQTRMDMEKKILEAYVEAIKSAAAGEGGSSQDDDLVEQK